MSEQTHHTLHAQQFDFDVVERAQDFGERAGVVLSAASTETLIVDVAECSRVSQRAIEAFIATVNRAAPDWNERAALHFDNVATASMRECFRKACVTMSMIAETKPGDDKKEAA